MQIKRKLFERILCIVLTIGLVFTAQPYQFLANDTGSVIEEQEILEDDSVYTYEERDDGTLSITGWTGSATEITIPESIDGKTVSTIGSKAFKGCDNLKSVILPDSVIYITKRAFLDCGITSIKISGNIQKIGAESIGYISGENDMVEAIFVGGVTIYGYAGTTAEEYAIKKGLEFVDCSKEDDTITKIEVVSICTIRVGESVNLLVTSDSTEANPEFIFSSANTNILTVDEIGKITGVKTGEAIVTVTSKLDPTVTAQCKVRVVFAPKEYSVGNSTFTYVEDANNFLVITNWTGTDTSIEIPYSIDGNVVKGINSGALDNATEVTSILIPSGVISIANNLFDKCVKLEEILVDAGNSRFESLGGVLVNKFSMEQVDRTSNYAVTNKAVKEQLIIPDGGTYYIGNDISNNYIFKIEVEEVNGKKYVFEAAEMDAFTAGTYTDGNILSVDDYFQVITSSKTKVDSSTKTWSDGYSSTQRIVFGGQIDLSVPKNAVKFTTSDSAVVTVWWVKGEAMRQIGLYREDISLIKFPANANCGIQYSVPDCVTSIGANAFNGCNLTNIVLGANVQYIGANAFDEASELARIIVDDENMNYEDKDGVLYDKSGNIIKIPPENTYKEPINGFEYINLTEGLVRIIGYIGTDSEVVIPSTLDGKQVVDIDNQAFYNNDNLVSVTVSDGIKRIGECVFAECSNLVSVNLPESMTEIGYEAFFNCEKLQSINLPNGIPKIGTGTFKNCSSLENITIPCSVKLLEMSSFASCTNLKKVVMLDGVEVIDIFVFADCTSLEEVVLSQSLQCIEETAFSNCTSLKQLDFPKSATAISTRAFLNCPSIEAFNVHEDNEVYKSINGVLFDKAGESLHLYPRAQAGAYSVPAGVKNIIHNAFVDCSISEITLPESVTSIPEYSMVKCSNLKNIYVDDKNTTYKSIDGVLYSGDGKELIIYPEAKSSEYEIPSGVTTIGREAFQYNNTINQVTIPESVTTIESSAFCECDSLYTITVPGSVATIGDYALGYDCIDGIIVKKDVFTINGVKDSVAQQYANENGIKFITEDNDLQYSVNEDGSITIIRYTGKGTELVVPAFIDDKPVKYIGDGAFGDTGLQSITLPEGLISCGIDTFWGCALDGLYIPASLEYIHFSDWTTTITGDIVVAEGNTSYKSIDGILYSQKCDWLYKCPTNKSGVIVINEKTTYISNHAFYGCKMVTEVVIPEGVTYIGGAAFSDCSNLKKIELPDGITELNFELFYGCSSLASVILPANLTDISVRVFNGCSSLADIELPDGITSIGDQAFDECSSLKSIVIPSQVTEVANYLFYGCSSLNSVTLPDGVTEVGFYAFFGCSSLSEIKIPTKVVSFGQSAFEDCTNLSVINLPEGLVEIPYSMFAGCSSLKGVTIPDSVSKIDSYAFKNCASLETIELSENVVDIQNGVFNGCVALEAINVSPDNQKYKSDNGVLFNKDGTLLIAFPGGVTGKYSVPETVEEIAGTAFIYCHLEEIIIPSKVRSIGSEAFSSSEELVSINVDENNSVYCSLDGVLFSKDMKTLIVYPGGKEGGYTVPEQVTHIGDYSFGHHKGLTEIRLPEGLLSIGKSSFTSCRGIASITIPESVTSIGAYAFLDSGISSVRIPNSVTFIGSGLGYMRDPIRFQPIEGFIIYGCSGSAAENYANKNKFLFVPYDEFDSELTLQKGNSVTIKVPDSFKEKVSFTSSDTSVVKVDDKGNVWAVSEGKTNILISICEDMTNPIVCEVTVSKDPNAKNGLVYNDDDGKWYYYIDGEHADKKTGMITYNGILWYIEKGILNKTYKGLVYSDGWYYVSEGRHDKEYVGVTPYNGTMWFVQDGSLNKNYEGLIFSDGWYYINDGKQDKSYIGLVECNGSQWYVKNGTLDKGITGLIYDNGWHYVTSGKKDNKYVGFANCNGNDWYVKEGTIDKTRTGLVYTDNEWKYVANGKYDKSYNGVTEMNGDTWYVKNGTISRTKGIWEQDGNIYYIIGGKADKTLYELKYFNGTWYYFRAGKADWTYNTLAYANNAWWYVNHGELDKSYTGLVEFRNQLWYVAEGRLNKEYAGTTVYNGVTYNVSNGIGTVK